jgi:hypothetical protein
MDELSILQSVRLKGRVSPADIAATLNQDAGLVAKGIGELAESGLLIEGKTVRLSPQGRARLNELLASERSGIDPSAIKQAYDLFRSVNADFKALVADWQIKDGQPNDHEDAEYDAHVLARLDGIQETVLPIIATVAGQIPRLTGYTDKLTVAMQKIAAGDTAWLTRPIIDSYHTVWFEMHEELIGAAGLTREAEAKAGYAQ